tara:strand:+ start:926 stop:1141 length:216 start_codon:yes stop_codon:yes gene_type:complete
MILTNEQQDNINAMKQYICESFSNWHIMQYVRTADDENEMHLEWAIRRGLEEHIEELMQENMELKIAIGRS